MKHTLVIPLDFTAPDPAPSVEVPRLVMLVCPYCKTEMKPFDYRGYYDSFVGWGCRCEKIPNAEKQIGQYA